MSSRISQNYEWIRGLVCALSSPGMAPISFDCDNLDPSTITEEAATTTQSSSYIKGTAAVASARTVPVFVVIVFDEFAYEISWQIRDLTDGLDVAKVPENTYISYEDEVVETVYLIPGHSYRFVIMDSYGDGLEGHYGCPFSGYMIVSGPTVDEGEELAKGPGDFDDRSSRVFTVPIPTTTPPSSTPSDMPSSAPQPTSRPTVTSMSAGHMTIPGVATMASASIATALLASSVVYIA